MTPIDRQALVFVAGHRGMVGSAIWRRLQRAGFTNLIGRSSTELDLRNQQATDLFFDEHRPRHVFLAAAKVGGIVANNTLRAEFIMDNMAIELNCLRAAHRIGVEKLLFLGSSCIYPKFAPQPLREEYLLQGYLEPTNEPYAIAKIAGIKMCDALRHQYGCRFISAMPTNLYGPGDNYHPQHSHVIPALIRKFHEAKVSGAPSVEIWGTGTPRREFLHADDLADACLFLMDHYDAPGFVNIGTGTDHTIAELAATVAEVVGYLGATHYDRTKPDGTPRKLMDVSRLHSLGWHHTTELKAGLKEVYEAVKGKL